MPTFSKVIRMFLDFYIRTVVRGTDAAHNMLLRAPAVVVLQRLNMSEHESKLSIRLILSLNFVYIQFESCNLKLNIATKMLGFLRTLYLVQFK